MSRRGDVDHQSTAADRHDSVAAPVRERHDDPDRVVADLGVRVLGDADAEFVDRPGPPVRGPYAQLLLALMKARSASTRQWKPPPSQTSVGDGSEPNEVTPTTAVP